jgi:hypothetical protein
MDTNDPRVSAIDAALYRLNPPTTPYSTPFTYNNGLTVLEILERIRRAVVDTITYAEGFGKEVEGMVKRINEVAEKWANDSKKKLDDFESFLNDSRTSTEAKINAMNTLIEEFKAKLIEHAFEQNGDYVSAPLMNGSRLDLVTKSAYEKFKTDTTNTINTGLSKVYTKEASDGRYNPVHNKLYPHSLIIGSSNAEPRGWPNGVWEKWLMGKGEIPHNYGYSGGGFTSTSDNNFNTQLDRAISELDGEIAKQVGQIYIIDMLNDIRGQNDIRNSASNFITRATKKFPNAKIYSIPVLYNEHSLNNNWDMAMNCAKATNTLKELLVPYGGLVCEGSRSWFHNGKNETYFPEGAGVHFSTAGYEYAQRRFDQWLNGDSGWDDYGWHNLKDGTNYAKVKNDNNLQAYVCRKRDTVEIHGTFGTIQMSGLDRLFTLPQWARPFRNMYVTSWNLTTAFPLIADTYSQLLVSSNLADNSVLSFNATYPIF